MVQALLNKVLGSTEKEKNRNGKLHKTGCKGNGKCVQTFDNLDKARDELRASVITYQKSIAKIESVLLEYIEE